MTNEEYEEFHRRMLGWRGIREHETPCKRCGGSGVALYGSTSTWRGGIGGCAMTSDVCDLCWGSGTAERPWTNLRALREIDAAKIREEAIRLVTRSAGGFHASCEAARTELVTELRRLSRSRKARPDWFASICTTMAELIEPEGKKKDEDR